MYKLDLSYLYIIITNDYDMYFITNYYDMYFIIETHSVLCLLLSDDKLYIHSGGSLKYQINDNGNDNQVGNVNTAAKWYCRQVA